MSKAEKIEERYLNGYVTDAQLLKYFELGVLTEEEYQKIYKKKHPDSVIESDESVIESDESVIEGVAAE